MDPLSVFVIVDGEHLADVICIYIVNIFSQKLFCTFGVLIFSQSG